VTADRENFRRGSSERSGYGGYDVDSAIGRAFDTPTVGSGLPTIVVPYFGNCTRPVGLSSTLGRDVQLGVRCRRCPGCLRARRFLWKLRAQAEMFQAAQTYLFTGTYRAQYVDLAPVNESITLWLKRLRERVDYGSLRYLVATERHKSGAWHMHALLHDVGSGTVDLGRLAETVWRDGFTNSKPCDIRGAGYVTKYVSKDLESSGNAARRPRMRASRSPRYGEVVMEQSEAIVRELQKRRIDLGETWTINLKEAIEMVDTKEDVWKNWVNSHQLSGPLWLDSERQVDRETGEIMETM